MFARHGLFRAAAFAELVLSPTLMRAQGVDFAHDVAPILRARCAECHTAGSYKGSVSFDDREAVLETGAAEPGEVEFSLLWERINADDPEVRMPPEEEPLSAEEKDVLRRWIVEGLPWEEGYTFRQDEYQAPLALRKVELPIRQPGAEHPIDRLLYAYWADYDLAVPRPADPALWLRRVHLDLTGLAPTAAETAEFLDDPRADKYERTVDELLARDRAYAEHWLTFWNDLLRNDYVGTGYIDGGRQRITDWLFASLLENKPFDQFARELFSPTEASAGFIAGIKWRGDVNASQTREVQFAQTTTQVFLGVNMKCASCHDSFIDDWKLTDAYGLAAIVSDEPLEIHRCDKPTGEFAQAAFLFPELGTIDGSLPKKKRLEQFAELMTAEGNGRFARTIVNRLWHRLFGRGIVHPVDVMANRPWDEDLLEYLAGYLVEHDYDVKAVLRHLATSQIYRAASVPLEAAPEAEGFVFQGPLVRRMSAEQFMDALWRITDTAPTEAAADFGDRGDEPVRASLVTCDLLMRSLGRPNREQVVTTRPEELTTLQALDLSNGAILSQLLDSGAANLLAAHPERTAGAWGEWAYRTALQRTPTVDEAALAAEIIGETPTQQGLADLLWIVFMTPEFQIIQ